MRDSAVFTSMLEFESEFLSVPRMSDSFIARVFSRVDASGDCWEWTGTLDPNGYGVLGRGARGAGNIQAHRAVYELMVGPIQEEMQYDHLCRNHSCVNPEHGEIVTPEENKRRGFSIARLHANRTVCPKGHQFDGKMGNRGGRETHRYCKTCVSIKGKAYRERKKAKRAEQQKR